MEKKPIPEDARKAATIMAEAMKTMPLSVADAVYANAILIGMVLGKHDLANNFESNPDDIASVVLATIFETMRFVKERKSK